MGMLTEEKYRLTPKDVLNHPWMKKYKAADTEVKITNKQLE